VQEREVERKRLGFKEIGRDGTFVKYANGMIYDEKTNLEWYAGPDKNITWNETKRWTESLNVDGGGWRMPTKKELKTLYKRWVKGLNIISLFNITSSKSCCVWSSRTKGSKAWNFDYRDGFGHWAKPHQDYPRPFAVRSRSDG
jgi:hypothetical protein